MDSKHIIEIPQWGSDSDWNEANKSIEHLIRIHKTKLDGALKKALGIQTKLKTLYPLLDEFCMESCVKCSSPCCITATVWLDFCDLIFIHLSGQTVPPQQLIEKQPDSCRYSSPNGCILPRLSRPWVCTLYLCPPQMALLRLKGDKIRNAFDQTVKSIKSDRKILENMFISIF